MDNLKNVMPTFSQIGEEVTPYIKNSVSNIKNSVSKMGGNSSDLEINVMMVGGRRCGKTSVLAAMQKCFENCFGTSNLLISPEDNSTLTVIEAKQQEIRHYFYQSGNRQFIPDNRPTSEINHYKFNIKLKGHQGSRIVADFVDYPGEWIKDPNHIDQISDLMKRSNVILIAIDTPYLMEDGGIYCDGRNYVYRITEMLKNNLNNDTSQVPKLVLFIPLKCERYEKKMKDVTMHVQKEYKALFDFFNGANAKYFESAILPIFTMGAAEFDRFERDSNGNIVIDENSNIPQTALYYFPNTNVNEPSPRYCEQPMIYLLTYMLEILSKLQKKNSNNILASWYMDVYNYCTDYLNSWLNDVPSTKQYLEQKEIIRRQLIKDKDGFCVTSDPLNIF